MDQEQTIKIAASTAIIAAIFTALVALLMLMNYYQLKSHDPLELESLKLLVEQLKDEPNNDDLRNEIRNLDLLARKAFFTNQWQVKTGRYLLLFGGIVWIFAMRYYFTARSRIKEPETITVNEMLVKTISQRWIVIAGFLLLVLAFSASFAVTDHLAYYQADRMGDSRTGEEETIEVIRVTDGAEEKIGQINVPNSLGTLIPADKQFNGPSGIALDELILEPLGLSRSDAWLCDLVPHSCVNPNQRKAIINNYEPFIEEYDLPIPTVPEVPGQLTDYKRRAAILEELIESGANTLLLLGDKPIQWFLKSYDQRWNRLTDFTQNEESYGLLHPLRIKGKAIQILPLAHPRQIAKLGSSSVKWYEYHQTWLVQSASKLYSSL